MFGFFIWNVGGMDKVVLKKLFLLVYFVLLLFYFVLVNVKEELEVS